MRSRRRTLLYCFSFCAIYWIIVKILGDSSKQENVCVSKPNLSINQASVNENGWNKNLLKYNKYLTDERIRVFSKIPNEGDYGMQQISHFATEVLPNYFNQIALNPDVMTYALHVPGTFLMNASRVTWPIPEVTRDIPWPRDSYRVSIETKACEKYLNTKCQVNVSTDYKIIASCENRSSLKESLLPIDRTTEDVFSEEYRDMMRHWERVFIHVIPHARVSRFSGRAANKNVVISPRTCAKELVYMHYDNITDREWGIGRVSNISHVDEVFVANHDGMFFHWTIEALSRLALYLDFLLANPEIKILIPRTLISLKLDFLEPLGIPRSRVVYDYATARVAYIPQGPRCRTNVSPQGVAMLSDVYLDYIEKNISPANAPKDVIVLIHRTKGRWLGQHEEIKDILQEAAAHVDMTLYVFSDVDLPCLSDAMLMFHRAALVVAPHGAGLINLLFSRPPTVVIEIICSDFSNTMSFMSLMRNLGHIYYSMRSEYAYYKPAIRKVCQEISVDLDKFTIAIDFYMSFLAKSR